MSWIRIATAMLVLAVCPAAASAATLAKTGTLFPADGKEPAGCWTAEGTRFELGHDQIQEHFDELWFEERAQYDGELVSPPLFITAGDVSDADLNCSPSGEVFVNWRRSGKACVEYRIVAKDHKSAGRVRSLSSAGDCWNARFAMWKGGYSVAWLAPHVGARQDIWAQAFDHDGNALYPPTVISDHPERWHGSPVLLADDEGNTLIVWQQEGETAHNEVGVVAVLASGETSGPPLNVLDGYGLPGSYSRDYVIESTGTGAFILYWESWPTGGLVGQRLRIEEIAPATTTTTSTTTSTTLEDDPTPEFGQEHAWDWNETDFYFSLDPKLASDGHGGWLAMWNVSVPSQWWFREHYRVVAASADAGRRWTRPVSLGMEPLALLADGAGGWMAISEDSVYVDRWTSWLHLSRSTDGGGDWSNPEPFLRLEEDFDDDCYSYVDFLAAKRSPEGTVALVWMQTTRCEWSDDGDDIDDDIDTFEVLSVRSTDGGESWSEPQLLYRLHGELGYDYYDGLEIETVGPGAWLVLVRGTFPQLYRSEDDALTWGSVGPAPEVPGWSGHSELACDSSNRCVAVFREWAGPEGNDRDGDVFATSSDDGGRTWSAPRTVNSYAYIDRSDDFSPAVGTDGNGLWTVAWVSHRDIGGRIGFDSDLVEASSTDGGATWTAARTLNPSAAIDGWLGDEEVQLAYSGGAWVALWGKRTEDWDLYDGQSQARTATADASCGDGVTSGFDECDDGNRIDGDGCDNNCYATACNNAIVTSGEECDDGNAEDDDSCPSDCAGARCGDGHVWKGFEECDDGNYVDADACTNECYHARCGDGLLAAGLEECDDGNTASEDGCLATCKVATCGDGYILDGVEECDDANSSSGDRCPAGCRDARCGDGYRWLGVEPCDPADPVAGGDCPKDCGIPGCGDANGDGNFTVTDSVTILSHAVGKPNHCPMSSCDVDGNFRISSRDALITLGLSVGLPYPVTCDRGPWLTIRVQGGPRASALQIRADTSAVPISMPTRGNGVPFCEQIFPDGLTAAHYAENVLTFGIISNGGFEGPVDIARCRVEVSGQVHPSQFAITIQDSTDINGNQLQPQPTVVLRVNGG